MLTTEQKKQRALAMTAGMNDQERAAWYFNWDSWARPTRRRPDGTYSGQQEPPGNWYVWLILAGRGWGKTKCGAETVRRRVERGQARRIALVGQDADDVREFMIEGESGLLKVCPPWNMPKYESSKGELTWPNGAKAFVFSGHDPDSLRGFQCDLAWCDELAKWKKAEEAWNMLMFGLRSGRDPRAIVTTTPRPLPLIKDLLSRPTTVVTTGSSYENRYLPLSYVQTIVRPYEGTRLGRQELHAEILDDSPGALWKRDQIDACRLSALPAGVELEQVVVAVDPAATSGEGADETGIIVCARGTDGHGYVLDDYTVRANPEGWAMKVVNAYHFHRADRIIAESNNGGEMVEHTIRSIDPDVSVELVHASRGKQIRAEPVSVFAARGQIHHMKSLPLLEDELVEWEPGAAKSPNRLDAYVWGFTKLLVGRSSSHYPIATAHINGGDDLYNEVREHWDPQYAMQAEAQRDQHHPAALPFDGRVEHDQQWEERAAREAQQRARVAGVLRQLGGRLPGY